MKTIGSILLGALCAASVAAHTCVHDQIRPIQEAQRRGLTVAQQEPHVAARHLSDSTWAPIRVVPEYVDISGISSDKQTYLQNTLIPEMAERLSTLLSVHPVSGNLQFQRDCTTIWTSETPVKCGDVAMPTCSDGSGIDITVPASYVGETTHYPSSPSTPVTIAEAGAGVANADFVLLVNAIQTSTCPTGSDGGTLAYATTCQRDATDRPILGTVNFCPTQLHVPSGGDTFHRDQLYTAIHEAFHAMGFSGSSWGLFRDGDGNPRTPRSAQYPTRVADSNLESVSCGGGSYEYQFADTMQYFSERGIAQCTQNDHATGSTCVSRMTSPSALQAARDYFNCSSLTGAEMESQPTTSCAVVPSHLEQRVFHNALMAPFSHHYAKITPVELAIMEDSGWYSANYSDADTFAKGADFGFGQGCEFAMDKCVASDEVTVLGTPAHYCTDTTDNYCTADSRAIGSCNLASYSSALPSVYQYFSTATHGGSLAQTDYCPVVQPYTNRMCDVAPSDAASLALYGMTFSSTARCFPSSSLLEDAYVATGNTQPACHSITCEESGGAKQIRVHLAGDVEVVCTSAGQQVSAAGFTGTLTCIDPEAFCSSGVVAAPDVPVSDDATDDPGSDDSGSDDSGSDDSGSDDTTSGGEGSGEGTAEGDDDAATSRLDQLQDLLAPLAGGGGAGAIGVASLLLWCRRRRKRKQQQVDADSGGGQQVHRVNVQQGQPPAAGGQQLQYGNPMGQRYP